MSEDAIRPEFDGLTDAELLAVFDLRIERLRVNATETRITRKVHLANGIASRAQSMERAAESLNKVVAEIARRTDEFDRTMVD